MLINAVIIFLMSLGLFFFLGTSVGIIRFPDFYTRIHAAGKGDTLSSVLLLSGLAIYNLHHFSLDALLVSLKIISIIIFIFVASPTASHAIIDAGFEANVAPWERKERKERKNRKEEEK